MKSKSFEINQWLAYNSYLQFVYYKTLRKKYKNHTSHWFFMGKALNMYICISYTKYDNSLFYENEKGLLFGKVQFSLFIMTNTGSICTPLPSPPYRGITPWPVWTEFFRYMKLQSSVKDQQSNKRKDISKLKFWIQVTPQKCDVHLKGHAVGHIDNTKSFWFQDTLNKINKILN